MAAGKIKVVFNSIPVEFLSDAAILSVQNQLQKIANDFVWIFAGGKPPNDFLNKIGVGLGMRNLTLDARPESAPTRACGNQPSPGMKTKKAHA